MITYQEEHYNIMFTPECNELFKQHFAEVKSFYKEGLKQSIDWDLYKTIGKNGNLKIYTVRDNDILIGYNMYFITTHLHYKYIKVADHDALFLLPKYRKGFIGYKFLKFCTQELKKKVNTIVLSSKASKSIEVIANRLGYKLLDQKFILEI